MVENFNHILVVDDEESVRNVIKDFLELLGHKVIVGCNGKEGLEYFNNSHRFKLVITDLKMPVMCGIEFARAIRKSDKPDTPIIAITAYFGNMGIERDFFNSIVAKPFKLESLEEIINQHLES